MQIGLKRPGSARNEARFSPSKMERVMRKGRIDAVTLSPLLLLALLPAGTWLRSGLAGTAVHPGIAFLKYFCIPLVGFSLGGAVFLGSVRKNVRPRSYALQNSTEGHYGAVLFAVSLAFFLCFSALAILRYTSLHTTAVDMGTYDNRIWRISTARLSAVPKELATGHFQPLLIFYALIYKLSDSPVVLQFLQSAAIISGVIPLYLISKKQTEHANIALLIALAYLFYPPVGFNSVGDFHPDHLYIPLMLWAFYFAEKDRYLKAVVFAGLGAMAKEPLILGAAFFGLYLALAKKRYKLGMAAFLFYLFLFLIVVYKILPHTNGTPIFQSGVLGGAFPFMQAHIGWIPRIKALTGELLMRRMRKALFIFWLLAPLLFLPLLDWKRFLPAVPLLAIPVLSTVLQHTNIDSQYTAGIVAPAFVAMVFSIKKIEKRFGFRNAAATAGLALAMVIVFSVADGPGPLSMNFWKPAWGGIWYRTNYTAGRHEKIIKKAISMVPVDPASKVISQDNINDARLAHRYWYSFFPDGWENADYVLLDTGRPLMAGDHVDRGTYRDGLRQLSNNPLFHLEFQKDGVLLFKRKEPPASPGTGTPGNGK